MIGSDCHDACTRLNTESCSLHAFVTCRLSYIVVGMHNTEASHAKSECDLFRMEMSQQQHR